MGMTTGGSGDVNADINVTPMVDIMLVLLIIFMVVTPLLSSGVPLTLPKDMAGSEEDPYINNEKAVVVSIPNDNEFYVGKDKYSLESLGGKIKTLMEGQTPDKRIVYIRSGLSADLNQTPVKYGTIVKAIEIIRQQDIDKIGLVADKKKGASTSQ